MIPEIPSWAELQRVMPEVWVVAAMCAVILIPFVRRDSKALPVGAALVGLALALVAVVATLTDADHIGPAFGGMLVVDYFSQFFKLLLIVFTVLVVGQWWITSRHETHAYDAPDFLCLLLGAVLGMFLMASASNLLMIFMAIESASLPSFALAGFRKRYRAGSEGALKYVLFGAASSAVMLYGISLIYGSVGSLGLGAVATVAAGSMTPLLAIGLVGLFVGIAFKLSAVPVHFWCPDVFQGAPIEVTTFLSVASKGAAMCLLVRILHTFGIAETVESGVTGYTGMAVGVAILGAVTATWGNLVALHQTNIRRLLAYSSIAHAGYMIMGASLIVGAGGAAQGVTGAILFYLIVYLFMNMGAFTIVGLVARETGSEDLREYAGLTRRSPVLAVLLTLFLLSLFGMPGLGGFMGKVYLMKSMADAGLAGFVLITVLLLNTLVSLYYYMRPVYYMAFVANDSERRVASPGGIGLVLLLLCATALLWMGLYPAAAGDIARDCAVMVSDGSIPPRSASIVEPGVGVPSLADLGDGH